MSENPQPINWQQLDEITGNDRELAKEFLEFFLENAKSYIDEMSQNGISSDDFNKLCHKLKGAAKSVGAVPLSELAYRGEKTIDASAFEQETLIQELKTSIKQIKTNIM